MARELTRTRLGATERPGYRAYLFPLVAFGALVLFLGAPWSLQHKAHAVLHGLCAQRPSHSFYLGGERLPFDARMTGIYGGFAAAAIYLALRGRFRAAAMPTKRTLAVLALFVGAMAVDGFNSTLVDLRLWHAYVPDNRLRLATGLLTGIALAVVMCYMIAVTLWHRPDMGRPPVNGLGELGLLVLIQAPFALAVMSGRGSLYAPLTMVLVVSAAAVLTVLMVVVVVLLRRREGTFTTVQQVQGSAALAFVLALGLMAILGGGRFLLEHVTNAPPMS